MLRRNWIIKAMVFACVGLASSTVIAAGFASQSQSGSGLANAYAGGAAVAEDAAVVWYNPAAMSRLSGTHLSGAVYLINNNRAWQDNGSTAAAGNVGLGSGTKISENSIVPNLFFVRELNDRMHFGLALNTPFGLKTEYDKAWMGRYQGVGSDIQTINLNAALSYKLSESLAIAGGINWQTMDAELTSMQNYAALAMNAAPTLSFRESLTTIKGSDSSWGYNLGAHFKPNPKSAIGFHYRSAIHFHLTGDVTFERPSSSSLAVTSNLANNLPNGGVTANITVPAMAHLSAMSRLGTNWEVMADLMWTQWSTVSKLEFERVNGGILSSTMYNWHDTFRYAVGANYTLNEAWKLKAGLAYDESPIPPQYRTARLPDNDRIWFSGGFRYTASKNLTWDFGYAYVMLKKSDLNGRREDNDPTGGRSGTLTGSFDQYAHIFGVQLNYQF